MTWTNREVSKYFLGPAPVRPWGLDHFFCHGHLAGHAICPQPSPAELPPGGVAAQGLVLELMPRQLRLDLPPQLQHQQPLLPARVCRRAGPTRAHPSMHTCLSSVSRASSSSACRAASCSADRKSSVELVGATRDDIRGSAEAVRAACAAPGSPSGPSFSCSSRKLASFAPLRGGSCRVSVRAWAHSRGCGAGAQRQR